MPCALRLHRGTAEAGTADASDPVPSRGRGVNFGCRAGDGELRPACHRRATYEIRWPDGTQARIQDFELAHATPFDIGRLGARLTSAIESVWSGATENDGFNRLLPLTGLAVGEITVLRACGRYLLQTGLPFSQAYMERVLQNNPGIALNCSSCSTGA